MDEKQTMTHDDITVLIFLIALAATLLQGILLVILGQVTVRKLRKNPATRNYLGMELFPGWDILNVSIALSRPRRWARLIENGPLGALYANSHVIRPHMTRLDRVLARIHFWSFLLMGVLLYGCMAYAKLG